MEEFNIIVSLFVSKIMELNSEVISVVEDVPQLGDCNAVVNSWCTVREL